MNGDLISREWMAKEISALKSHARSFQQVTYATGYMCGLSVLQGRLADAPAVDAAPVAHGRWIEHVHVDEDGDCSYIDYECPACHVTEHFEDDGTRAFCPNCGAKMDEK